MTELELRRGVRKHVVRVSEEVSLEDALKMLERMDRDWVRGKRKYA